MGRVGELAFKGTEIMTMKKLMAIAVGAMMIAGCTGTKNAAEVGKTGAQLLKERLDTLKQKGIMYGHQDDPFYGLTWEYQADSSDVKNVCGEYPAVMGFELGGIEMGDEKSLDSVPFTRITQEVVNHYNRGGIITISWHPRNPVTTIDGGGPAGEYKALWNMVQDKLIADGFDNIVWAYSPGCQDNLTAERLLDRYPGDDRVDMLGLDGYQWVPEEKDAFMARTKQNLEVLCKVAGEHNLIPALTECGMKNMTEPTWWTSTLLPAVEDYPISYLLTWRNYKDEWFGPSPSKPDAQYFRDFHNSDKTLFINDIK